MTIAVCFTYDQVAPSFSQEMENTQWGYLLDQFQPNKIYVKGLPSGSSLLTNKAFTRASSALITDYSQIVEPIVYLTPQDAINVPGEVSLVDYVHPETCCYVFGPNEGHLISDVAGDKVYIPTSSVPMYNWCACAIALYDRKVKRADI